MAAPPLSVLVYLLVPPAPAYRLTRPVPPPGVNSASSIPILRSRHSSASALPVVSAILGMCPSLWLRGKRVWFMSVQRRVRAVRDHRHGQLAPPLADLDHQRHVGADRHVLEREVSGLVGERRRDRLARQRGAAAVAARALGHRVERRVGHVDDDVVERDLAGGIVDRAADRGLAAAAARLRRARAARAGVLPALEVSARAVIRVADVVAGVDLARRFRPRRCAGSVPPPPPAPFPATGALCIERASGQAHQQRVAGVAHDHDRGAHDNPVLRRISDPPTVPDGAGLIPADPRGPCLSTLAHLSKADRRLKCRLDRPSLLQSPRARLRPLTFCRARRIFLRWSPGGAVAGSRSAASRRGALLPGRSDPVDGKARPLAYDAPASSPTGRQTCARE